MSKRKKKISKQTEVQLEAEELFVVTAEVEEIAVETAADDEDPEMAFAGLGRDDEDSEDESASSDEEALELDLGLNESQSTEDKNIFDEMIAAGEASEEADAESGDAPVEGSELEGFDSAEIEDVEFVEEERLDSILESMLFASDRPISLATFKMTFKGTSVRNEHLKRALDRLAVEYAGGRRGISLDEVPGGYQVRTKLDNMKFLTRTLKVRPFRVSGAALEVLSIVAYKQPVIKSEIDDIRGVESGHLLRALMEKGLVQFEGKSDFPGRPMLYGTTKKFLEIFGLRNLKELPTLSQIDELLPEGIGDEQDVEKSKLGDLTDKLSQNAMTSYSDGEEELNRITETLSDIDVSSEFFELEKIKQKEARDGEKATGIREALMLGESVPKREKTWLERYDAALADGTTLAKIAAAKEKNPFAKKKASAESGPEVGLGAVAGELSALTAEDAVAEFDAEADADEAADSDEESQDEATEARFEEEEDISLDQDLNVPYHDDEDSENS